MTRKNQTRAHKNDPKTAPASAIPPVHQEEGMGEFMTVNEVALRLNFTPRTIRKMCQKKKLPGAIQIGEDWRIKRTTFREYLDGKLGESSASAVG